VKDILILWDNSRSVGLSAFQDSVIPFLKNFVNSARLNVGSDGTHIGIITFSSPRRTHTLLKIGDITSPEQLTSYLDNLNYKELSGGSTTTGKAFEIANSVSIMIMIVIMIVIVIMIDCDHDYGCDYDYR
jgi:hypothetical protein